MPIGHVDKYGFPPTNNNNTASHAHYVGIDKYRHAYGQEYGEYLPKAFASLPSDVDGEALSTIAEHYLFGYCDSFVTHQQNSGYGRTAAVRSLKLDHIYDGQHCNQLTYNALGVMGQGL